VADQFTILQGSLVEMRRILAILLLLMMNSGGCANSRTVPAMDTASWIIVNSDRFEIFSTLSEDDTKALATDLERFHALIYAVTSAPTRAPVLPTRIFAFKRKSDYRRFAPKDSAGAFQSGIRTNNIILTDFSREHLGASEIVLHEYVHFVLRNATTTEYPIWYDEGFAEFLSTARVVEGGRMAVGIFPKVRLNAFKYLPWISIERIIEGKSYKDFPGRKIGMFYAEAWALVHYLTLDRSEKMTIGPDLTQYLSLVEREVAPPAAFREAFGESTVSASKNIQRMLERGDLRIIGIPLAKLDFDRSDPTVRVPSVDEIHVRFGQLGLSGGDGERAEVEFSAAIAFNPENSRAQAGLGDAHKLQERYAEAEPFFLRAVELDPLDVFNQLDLAEYYQAFAMTDEGIKNLAKLLEQSRASYRRAMEIDASSVESTAMLGSTHLAPGENAILAIPMLEDAYAALPSSGLIRDFLAEAYIATDQIRKASLLLRSNAAAHGSGDVAESVESQIEAILKRRTEDADRVASAATASSPISTSE
jgi:tetratricopeptide (TPR) repeat protein